MIRCQMICREKRIGQKRERDKNKDKKNGEIKIEQKKIKRNITTHSGSFKETN